jgi:hypothetical protein
MIFPLQVLPYHRPLHGQASSRTDAANLSEIQALAFWQNYCATLMARSNGFTDAARLD